MAFEISLTTEQKVLIHAAPMTEAGNPAVIDGAVLFSIDQGTCTIEPNDATSAYIVSGSSPGDSTVRITCDADIGAGVVTIEDIVLAHVTNAMAENLTITAEAPVLK